MSKELPYFKFFVNEWITGDITLEDYDTQGLFINLCAYYWSKDCKITLSNAKRKFKDAKPEAFDALLDGSIIKVASGDFLIISFLDEQNSDREKLSKTNSENGKKGGRPPKEKTENKPNALNSESESLTKKSNIEKRREEQIRKEEKKEDDVVNPAPSSSIFSLDNFIAEITIGENEFTLLTIRKTGRTPNELNALLQEFITEQRSLSKLIWQNGPDAKNHFINWVKKQPTHKKSKFVM